MLEPSQVLLYVEDPAKSSGFYADLLKKQPVLTVARELGGPLRALALRRNSPRGACCLAKPATCSAPDARKRPKRATPLRKKERPSPLSYAVTGDC